jgi:hypothetical protein
MSLALHVFIARDWLSLMRTPFEWHHGWFALITGEVDFRIYPHLPFIMLELLLAALVLWFTRPGRGRRVSREESEDTTWAGGDSFAGDADGDSSGDE